jgi:N-acyl-D-aspartate/D-glutamate deacylase
MSLNVRDFDLIITGGLVVDGTGAPARRADIGVRNGLIAAIGQGLGTGRERIDASGMIVTPGFIDVHTHFDAQVTWDDRVEPAVWHGVTTAVIGNCGVGFAPAKPESRAVLIDMMASVEDIPAESMNAALPWNWETYPEFLEVLDSKPRTINIASMITHSTLRTYVMGERRAENPTAAELQRMAELVREGMRAGAVGLSMSRTVLHTTGSGEVLPGTFAGKEELMALARAVREGSGGKRGILEVSPASTTAPEPVSLTDDVDMLISVSQQSGCPVVFSLLQSSHAPLEYETVLAHVAAANAAGARVYAEVATRPIVVMMSLEGGFHPFSSLPSFAAVRDLPLPERVAALRNPELRRRIVQDKDPNPTGLNLVFADPGFWSQVFPLRTPINYYPPYEDSFAAQAERRGVTPQEIAYDALLEDDGKALISYAVVNWARRSRADLHRMVTHPNALLGLGDGGAHLTSVVDVSQPTSFLAQWVRDEGPDHPYGMSLEAAVKKLTLDNAAAFGLSDRGLLAPGMRADINLIDLERLAVGKPRLVNDLPLGKPRFDQRATGYVATVVNGQVVVRNDELTSARPGRLARGAMT